jgi:hemolysin activation/secretion protein
MKNRSLRNIVLILLFINQISFAQDSTKTTTSRSGWFSLGGRSTLSAFSHDGNGLGTGGQFRLQLSNRVNTDWFADYISITISDKVRSEYYHIGWSVLFYPFEKLQFPKVIQPYILAGHCFDYNVKTIMNYPSISKDRWGSAVQAGLGTHFNLSNRFDVSLTCQYMIHLTKEIDAEIDGESIVLVDGHGASLEGHLLTTVSLNYKLFRIWKK